MFIIILVGAGSVSLPVIEIVGSTNQRVWSFGFGHLYSLVARLGSIVKGGWFLLSARHREWFEGHRDRLWVVMRNSVK